MQYTVPGSEVKMTRAQVGKRFNVGDWFPNDHAKMPYVVQYRQGAGRPRRAASAT